MSPGSKHDLARAHLQRAQTALDEDDLVVAVTFVHLAAEAAVVVLADQAGIETSRRHDLKARAATSLHERGVLEQDLGPDLRHLNQLRKDVTYEGEEVALAANELAALFTRVSDAVRVAERRAG